jgi:hypothetical protein
MHHIELKPEFPAVIYLYYSVAGQYTFIYIYISLMISLTRNLWYKVWIPIVDLQFHRIFYC